MNIIYEKMKHLIPCRIKQKSKVNFPFLIVTSKSGDVFYLNEVAKDFYELCDGKTRLEEIVEKYLKIYEVDRDTIENDFVGLVRDFQWKQIIILKEFSDEKLPTASDR